VVQARSGLSDTAERGREGARALRGRRQQHARVGEASTPKKKQPGRQRAKNLVDGGGVAALDITVARVSESEP